MCWDCKGEGAVNGESGDAMVEGKVAGRGRESETWRDWCEVIGEKPGVDCSDKVRHIERHDQC